MTILVADDDAKSRKLLRVSLEAEGHKIAEVADGYEALAVLKELPIDVVIADVFMPRLDGYELCRQFRANSDFNSKPFIFYSGAVASHAEKELARHAGAFAYVPKPELGRLLTLVRTIPADEPGGAEDQKVSAIPENGLSGKQVPHPGFELDQTSHELQTIEDRAESLAAIVENSRDAILSTTLDGTITSWNPAAEQLYGYSASEAIGQQITLLIPSEFRLEWQELIDRLRRGDPVDALETLRTKKGGDQIIVSARLSPIRNRDGAFVGISEINRDITEQKRAEEELRNSREQLRLLAIRTQTAREAEALRISREVHDELGQALTALSLDLVALEKRVARQEPVEELNRRLRGMQELVQATVTTVQRIASELRPGVLDDLGLTAALEWQADEFRRRTGLTVQWTERPASVELPRATGTAVFRIFQEILTNVARHARARCVALSFEPEVGGMRLRVSDDGVGFVADKLGTTESIGLVGMRERTLLFGGSIVFQSAPGHGTEVVLHIPEGKDECANPDRG